MDHCAFGKFEQQVGYLLYIYLHLLTSVSSSFLTEYGFKRVPVAMIDKSSVDPHNCKALASPE